MGKSGRAFTIFTHSEKYLVYEIENYAKIKLSYIEFNLSSYREKINELYKGDSRHDIESALRRSNFNPNRGFSRNKPYRKEFGSNKDDRHYSGFKRNKFKRSYFKED